MNKFFLISFIIIILFSSNLYSQISKLGIEHISEKNGLSSNRIEAINQDTKGFIWIGTSDGLCRYDGYNFQTYKPNSDDTNSICGNIVRDIDIEDNGKVWIGTDDGLSCYNPEKETFTNYTITPNKPKIFIEQVEHLSTTKSGNIWFLNKGNILTLFDIKENKFYFFQHDFQNENINSILEDKDENIWITTNKGLSLLSKENLEKKIFIKYSFKQDNPLGLLKNSAVIEIFSDKQNQLWILNNNICRIDSLNNENIFLTRLFDNNTPKELHLNNIININQSIDGNYWFLNNQHNLFNYNIKNNKLLQYTYSRLNQDGIRNSISNIFCDNSGVVWLTSGFEGIDKFDIFNNGFNFIQHIPGNKNSLLTNNVFSIYEDSKGVIWISTNEGVLSKFNRKENTLKHIKLNSTQNYNQHIFEILEDSNNNLWLCSSTLERVTTKKRNSNSFDLFEIKSDKTNPYALHGWNIYCIMEDIDGDLLIPISGNLSILPKEEKNKINPNFQNYTYDQNNSKSLLHEVTWRIFQDTRGRIWMGTNNGLSLFNKKTALCTNFFHSFSDTSSLSNDNIKCVYESKNGTIWLGTEGGGLNRFNERNHNFTKFGEKQGLANEIVWGILEDKHGKLWLNTNSGISCFNPTNKSFKNYNIIAENTVNSYGKKGYCKTIDGEMFFSSEDGIVHFYPDSLKEKSFAPPIIITDFKIFNISVPVGKAINNSYILSKSISETKKIVLSWKQNSFSFEFSALDYANPSNIKYAYKMEGFDKDWIYTDASKRYATYTNLDAGEYSFKVKSTNSDGVWSNNESEIDIIKIIPPFWKTTWFISSIIIILLSYIFFSIKYRINKLKKQRDKLEETVKERTAEINNQKEELKVQAENLQEVNNLLTDGKEKIENQAENLKKLNSTKDKFFSIIAHDLKNPFHAIAGMSSLLNKSWEILNTEKKKEFVQMIETSSKGASNLLENLLQWSRSQTNQIKYKPTSFDISEIINETINLLKINTSKKKIQLKSNIPGKSFVFADQNMITTVIRNLVNNAIKFTHENGDINILGENINTLFKITVKDNGVGMTEEVRNKLFNIDSSHSTTGTSGESGTGLGLIICKEFVEKNGGKLIIESKINHGSDFIFTLPTQK